MRYSWICEWFLLYEILSSLSESSNLRGFLKHCCTNDGSLTEQMSRVVFGSDGFGWVSLYINFGTY